MSAAGFPDQEPLRFALMCNGSTLKKWQLDAVRQLLSLDYTSLDLIIRNAGDPAGGGVIKKVRSWLNQYFLHRLWMKFFCRPAAMSNVDISDLFRGVPRRDCRVVRKGKYSEYFTEEDVASISEYGLDFMVRFGFNILKGPVLNAARFGIWSYHHSDEQKYRGGTTGFWEVYSNDPVNGAILQRITEDLDSGIVLKKGYFKTSTHSLRANISNLLEGTSGWLKCVCVDIRNGAAGYFDKPSVITNSRMYPTPANRHMLIFPFKLLARKIRFHYQDLFMAERWNLGVANLPLQEFVFGRDKAPVIAWFDRGTSSTCLADGFAFLDKGKIWILCEEFSYKENKSSLAIIEYSPIKGFSTPSTLLKKATHLSYPYTICYEGKMYCIPESCNENQVNLYEFDPSSNKLVLLKTLLKNLKAVDSTVFRYQDRWWLFCTLQDCGSNTYLYAYYADRLDGDYLPHANNPVKTDIRSARPAGRVFVHEGKYYRPSQDCSTTYGGEININRIVELTPTCFSEVTEVTLQPSWRSPWPHGMHTITEAGSFTLIDAKRHVFNPYHFLHRLKSKLGRLFRRKPS